MNEIVWEVIKRRGEELTLNKGSENPVYKTGSKGIREEA